MRKVLFMLIAICAVVAASLPLASPANATTPGRNGRITFMEPDAAGFWQVWVANADLSGQKQLTHGAANSGGLCGRQTARRSPSTLITMKPNGSSIRYLTATSAQEHQPDWQSIRF
jgi:hypothetical protein